MNTLIKSEKKQKNDTIVKIENNGIKNIIKIVYEKLKNTNIYVLSVEKSVIAQEKHKNIVPVNVEIKQDEENKSLELALYAEKNLQLENIDQQNVALQNVQQNLEPVYNITVK